MNVPIFWAFKKKIKKTYLKSTIEPEKGAKYVQS